MSSHRKRSRKQPDTEAPALTGVVKLLSEMPIASLDLHGYMVAQARPRVRDFLTTHSRVSSGLVVHLITGKGTHSEGDAVLRQLVQDMLLEEVADMVQEYGGMLGGGGWVVRMR